MTTFITKTYKLRDGPVYWESNNEPIDLNRISRQENGYFRCKYTRRVYSFASKSSKWVHYGFTKTRIAQLIGKKLYRISANFTPPQEDKKFTRYTKNQSFKKFSVKSIYGPRFYREHGK